MEKFSFNIIIKWKYRSEHECEVMLLYIPSMFESVIFEARDVAEAKLTLSYLSECSKTVTLPVLSITSM